MLKKKVKLSIVIPVHNRHGLFLECLKLVFEQKTRYSFEVIIIDDASDTSVKSYLTKNSKKFLQKLRIYRNNKNMGPAVSRNIGLSKSKGEYVMFLDSDDFLNNKFVEVMVSLCDSKKLNSIMCNVTPKFINIKKILTIFKYYLLNLSRKVSLLYSSLFNKSVLPESLFYMMRLSGMIFRRSCILNISFDKRYKSAEDWKFLLDIYKNNNFSIYVTLKTLVTYSYHNDSETLGRTGYFKYYRSLIDAIPSSKRNNFGIYLFKIYSNYEK